ncbi:ankyrin repeat domain-containing protein [Chromobacterium piscinae]|uniref:ankyrin repeat domain-containing protein n=1 Tax=Chromobacterium piscinae TaxID=686831 RepID=UPI001E3A43FD|nr:ankyrin repeat domain-containing protein [Chromobacterium piscinae]MCD5327950.1 ankyrin repeat domain-containing protein [Chromobacterium piscinae]
MSTAQKDLFEMLHSGDFATARKHMELHGIDPNIKDTAIGGFPPLLFAVKGDDLEFAKYLVEKGADVNWKSNVSLLHVAPSAIMAELLLDAGAKVNVVSNASPIGSVQKGTPLHYAVFNDNPEVAELLIKRGANINAIDANRRTPLHYAEARSQKMAAILLQNGANPEMRDRWKETPADLRNSVANKGELSADTQAQTAQSVVEQAALVEKSEEVKSNVQDAAAQVQLGEGSIRPAVPRQQRQTATQSSPVANGTPTKAAAAQDEDLVIKNASPQQKTQDEPKKKEPPKRLHGGQFLGNEKGEYRRIGEERVALFDDGDQIRFNDKQMDTFKAGVELAKEKGWSAIEVQGNERFRREAWLHAQASGIEVIGYDPNEKDLKDLEQLVQRQKADSIGPAVESSLEDAKDIILANGKGYVAANEKDGAYAGTVIGETDHHVIVMVDGRAGTATALQKDKLDGLKVKPGEVLKTQFRDGKALKKDKPQAQTRSLAH